MQHDNILGLRLALEDVACMCMMGKNITMVNVPALRIAAATPDCASPKVIDIPLMLGKLLVLQIAKAQTE